MIKNKKNLFKIAGAVIIIVIIFFAILQTYNNSVNVERKKIYQTKIELIIDEAKKWIENNTNKLPKDNGVTFIELSTLINDNYLKSDDLVNPYTNKTMNGCITISLANNNYKYEYNDLICEDLKQNYKPTFDYTNKNEEVEVNSVYSFPTKIIITNKNGKSLVASDPIIKKNNNVVTSIDTSTIGDEYEVFYNTYDADFDTTYSDSYKVKVVDKIGPTITINHSNNATTNINDYSKNHKVYIVQGNTYNLPDATITDDSCGITMTDTKVNNCSNTLTYTKSGNVDTSKPGYYDIKYTAKDSSNNTSTLTLTVVITPTEFNCTTGECTYTIVVAGTYKLDGYGAQGGNNGGLGGYISASAKLNIGDIIKLKVGTTAGYNGGGVAGANGASGGGASTINKNGVTILTAAGGGATGSTVGGAGGIGSGNGASKQANCGSAAGDGINGGGGGSTGSCTYEAEETYSCTKPCNKQVCDANNNCTTVTYDCESTCTGKVTKTSYGTGGIGGASSLGTNIIQIERQDGNHSGNGKATISYISE